MLEEAKAPGNAGDYEMTMTGSCPVLVKLRAIANSFDVEAGFEATLKT